MRRVTPGYVRDARTSLADFPRSRFDAGREVGLARRVVLAPLGGPTHFRLLNLRPHRTPKPFAASTLLRHVLVTSRKRPLRSGFASNAQGTPLADAERRCALIRSRRRTCGRKPFGKFAAAPRPTALRHPVIGDRTRATRCATRTPARITMVRDCCDAKLPRGSWSRQVIQRRRPSRPAMAPTAGWTISSTSGWSREIILSALSIASSSRAGPFSNSSAMNTYRSATFR
jgi:hypothetical protein